MEEISVFLFVQRAADVFLVTGNVRRVLISRYVEFPDNITRKISYQLCQTFVDSFLTYVTPCVSVEVAVWYDGGKY